VELGGALKNVIAIAAGITDGAGFGDNTKAAIMTRGIREITRLGVYLGAQEATFMGLSGIGDLIVTCMSRHSRNRYVGEEIGRGRLNDVLGGMKMIAEG
jgi:glycerol-3-phosphate dehydrogenase (NAD(P)+)